MNPQNRLISVVIPTYNSWSTLKECIKSIQNQSLKPREIIVVDNGSSDDTATKVKKNFPKVRLIKLDKNTGVTGGRNAGIEKVQKGINYIFFFDHDMVADKDMLKNLVTIGESDQSFGIVTPKIYYWEDKKRIWAAGTNINLWTGQVLFRGGVDKGQFEKIEEVQVAPAAMLVRKNVLENIYEFDNRYVTTYEDTDFCFRAKQKGFKTIYTPQAIAYHKISPDPNKEQQRLLERAFWIGRNRILFMGDYGKNFYLFLFFSPIYLLYFIKLAIEQKNYKGLSEYLKGVVAGLIEELVTKRILVYLPFTMYNILARKIGGGPKKVLDVACGDGLPMSILNRHKMWEVTGIDIYAPSVERAKQRGVYEKVIVGDIRQMGKLFSRKEFDVVLCSSVLDHLEKKDASDLIAQCEKLGKKVILSGLPNGFLEKHEAYFWEGDNPHQEHKSHWELEDFTKLGYRVFGFGSFFMIGRFRISQSSLIKKYSFLSPLKLLFGFLENLFAYLLSPVTFYFPKTAVCLMAIKNTKRA